MSRFARSAAQGLWLKDVVTVLSCTCNMYAALMTNVAHHLTHCPAQDATASSKSDVCLLCPCCRCLAGEADLHAHAQMTPPSVSALREYSRKLQEQMREVSNAIVSSPTALVLLGVITLASETPVPRVKRSLFWS